MVDVVEVSKLRHEVREPKTINFEFEKESASLLDQTKAVDDKAFNLLADNSGLITECESMSKCIDIAKCFLYCRFHLMSRNKSFMVKKKLRLVKEKVY